MNHSVLVQYGECLRSLDDRSIPSVEGGFPRCIPGLPLFAGEASLVQAARYARPSYWMMQGISNLINENLILNDHVRVFIHYEYRDEGMACSKIRNSTNFDPLISLGRLSRKDIPRKQTRRRQCPIHF